MQAHGARMQLSAELKNALRKAAVFPQSRARKAQGQGRKKKGKGKLAGQKGKGQYEGPAPAQKGKPAVAEQESREERWEQTPMGKGAAAAQKGIPAVADHDPEPPWANYRTIEARRAESDAWFDSYLDELHHELRYADYSWDYM